MTDIVTGIRLTADGKDLVGAVRASSDEIKKMGDTAAQTSSQTARLSEQQRNLATTLQAQNAWFRQTTASMQANNAALTSSSDAVQKLLDRFDPLGTKLRALQSDMQVFRAALTTGLPGVSDDAILKTERGLNDEIAKTKGLMIAAGAAGAEGFGMMSSGAIAASFSTAQARRELIVLGHEAMTGNFSRMPGSFMVLAERMSATALLFNPITAAIVALTIVAGALAKAYHDGAQEMDAMNKALALTNNFAGMTRGTMRSLAQDISATGAMTVGTSKDIVTAIVASGRYSTENVAGLARTVGDYAAATGQAADKVTPQLIKMFEDPAKASETLNQQYHYLSVAEQERIRSLQTMGQTQDAVAMALKALDDHLTTHKQNLGLVEQAWLGVKNAMSWVLDHGAAIGRAPTPEELVARQEANVGVLQSKNADPAKLAAAQAYLAVLRQQVDANAEAVDYNSAMADLTASQAAAQKIINQSVTYRVRALQDELTNVKSVKMVGDALIDQKRREYELTKQIGDLQRGLGSEERTLAVSRINDATKLFTIQEKSAAENFNAQLSLGVITKAQHAAALLSIDLEAIARKKADDAHIMALGGLTKLQKQNLTDDMAALDAETKARQQLYDNKKLIEYNQQLQAQAEMNAKSSEAMVIMQFKTLDGLDAEIKKIKERNAAIGKTKEQMDLLAADRVGTQIELLERYATAERDQNENSPLLRFYDAEIDRLKQIQSLLKSGAIDEAANAAQKKSLAAQKKMNEDLQRGLADSIFRGFEAGKGFAQNFRDALVNMFKTTILTPVIKWIVSPLTGAITAGLGSLGIPGLANAAGASGGIGSLFSGGGGIGSLLSNLGGGANAIFQNLGVSTGSQFLADIGNYGYGIPAISGLAMAAGGNVSGGIGSTLGGIAGSYFGPVGTVIGSALGGYAGSLFGGGGGPTQGDATATIGPYAAFNSTANGGYNPAGISSVASGAVQNLSAVVTKLGGTLQAFGISIAQGGGGDYSVRANLASGGRVNLGDSLSADQMQLASARAVLVGLQQAADFPDYLKKVFSAINAGIASTQQINDAIAFADTLKTMHDNLAETRPALAVMTDQVAQLEAQLGTGPASIKADFLAAITAGITPDVFAKWQKLSTLADALAQAQTQQLQTQTQQTDQLKGAIQGLPGQLGITSLQQYKDSLAVSDTLSPLDRLSAARGLLSDTYTRALAGDLSAVNAFPGAAQSLLGIGRDAYASGPQYQDLFVEVNRELQNVLTHQQDVQSDLLKNIDVSIVQAAQDQTAALKVIISKLNDLNTQLETTRAELRRISV